MYKIKSVEINGFWHRMNVECSFNPEVNIIIGKNGSGKTTFMNILYGVLAVDFTTLSENDFDTVKVILEKDNRTRTIKATKFSNTEFAVPLIEYQISQRKTMLRIMTQEDRRSIAIKRQVQEQAATVRNEINNLISLTSLSVYRLRSEDEYEIRDRHGSRVVSPVDFRLDQALRGLTQYELILSQMAREVAAKLQADVLASILYTTEDTSTRRYQLDFDKASEQKELMSAYRQLNSLNPSTEKKSNLMLTQ